MENWRKSLLQHAALLFTPLGWKRNKALSAALLGAAGIDSLLRRDHIIQAMHDAKYEYVGKSHQGDEEWAGSYLPRVE